MKLLGILVLAAGIAVGIFGLAMDTSIAERVETQRGYIGVRSETAESVPDAGLERKKKVWLWVGGFLAVAGLGMALMSGRSAGETVTGNAGDVTGGGDDEWVVENELNKRNKGAAKPQLHQRRQEIVEEMDDEEGEEEYEDEAYLVEEEEDNVTDDVHSITETLIKLNELRKEGVLTDEEFNAQKAKLLRK